MISAQKKNYAVKLINIFNSVFARSLTPTAYIPRHIDKKHVAYMIVWIM